MVTLVQELAIKEEEREGKQSYLTVLGFTYKFTIFLLGYHILHLSFKGTPLFFLWNLFVAIERMCSPQPPLSSLNE